MVVQAVEAEEISYQILVAQQLAGKEMLVVQVLPMRLHTPMVAAAAVRVRSVQPQLLLLAVLVV
jgi:hypothetical protein